MLKYLCKPEPQKRFRTVALTVFAAWVGLIVIRICMRWVPSNIDDTLFDAIFTIPVQLGLLLVLPFCMYKFVLKMSFKEVLDFSNVRKTKPVYLLLAVPIGFCAFAATIGVSTVWQTVLILLGYTHTSSSTDPSNPWMIIVSLLLTAVLPAVCEEFSVRGGLLTTVNNSYKLSTTLVLMGVCFGLFHQNITQVFYTALFGALTAFIALKCKSILPTMIIHFINNGISVYLDYAETFGWWGGGLFNWIDTMAQTNLIGLLGLFVLIVGIGAGLVVLMLYIMKNEKLEKKKALIEDAGFDHTNNRVVLMGEENKQIVEDVGLTQEVYGKDYTPTEKFKPSLRDSAFFIGAIVLSALTTVFSFIWGLFY